MTSLRRRILLPLLPLLGVALLVTGLAVYGAVRADLLAGLDRTLLVLARGVGSAVDVELGGVLEFEDEVVEALAFPGGSGDRFYVVRGEDGSLVGASLDPAPGPFAPAAGGPRFERATLRGRTYRLCTLPVSRAPEPDEEDREEWLEEHPGEPLPDPVPLRFQVTVGHTTAEVDRTLGTLRDRLLLGFGGLFAALAALPWWLVSRALRRLNRLSHQADGVGPKAPERRLAEDEVDGEVLPLVAALNRALDRLASAYERQKRFTADAAHELRTPLSALRAQCEVALRRPRTRPELRETLEAVHRTTLRLGDLVEHLLALARLQGEVSVLAGSADLARAARDAAGLHAGPARAKGLSLTVEVPPSLPVRGREALLVECLSNLVGNAVRYTPAGGEVRVTGGSAPGPAISVRDTGIGVGEEHRDRIFDRFYRADPSRSRAEGGAGLGLSIAQEIARLHGGEVRLEAGDGNGSVFELRLPPAPEARAPDGSPREDLP